MSLHHGVGAAVVGTVVGAVVGIVGAVVGIGGDGVVVVVLEDVGCVVVAAAAALRAPAVPSPNLNEVFLRLTLVRHSAVHLVPVESVPPIRVLIVDLVVFVVVCLLSRVHTIGRGIGLVNHNRVVFLSSMTDVQRRNVPHHLVANIQHSGMALGRPTLQHGLLFY